MDERFLVEAEGGEPDIALDPTSSARIIVAGNAAPWYSTDAGQTWLQSSGAPGGDANVEFDGAATAWHTGTASSTPPQPGQRPPSDATLLARSTDHGATFTSLQPLVQGPTTSFLFPDGSSRTTCVISSQEVRYDYPRLAADKSSAGVLYVTAQSRFPVVAGGTCTSNQDSAIFKTFAVSTDGGATWSDHRIVPDYGSAFDEDMAVAADGALYISGVSAGNALCTGNLVIWKHVPGTAGFQPEVCARSTLVSGRTWVAADPGNANNLVVAYESMVGTTRHIYATGSVDAGAHWSTPKRLDDVLVIEANREYPIVSITSGRIDAAWVDYRNNPNADNSADIYFTYSTDNGATWAQNLRGSHATAPILVGSSNDYFGLGSSPTQAALSYAQDRDGDGLWEWYFGSVSTFPGAATPPVPPAAGAAPPPASP